MTLVVIDESMFRVDFVIVVYEVFGLIPTRAVNFKVVIFM